MTRYPFEPVSATRAAEAFSVGLLAEDTDPPAETRDLVEEVES
jgi:hypothetical protein